jgi:DNA-binding winged helix-turn-helix (wHTH) protein/TolB-like protein/Tfp pilus assembly protein PilF
MGLSGVFLFRGHSFDCETGDLSNGDQHIRLTEQNARVLAVLLERAGRIVTREQIREQLWSNEDFLDYDQRINNIVSKLRSILGDDPKAPVFLETIPKRGYRFLAEVERVTAEPPESGAMAAVAEEAPLGKGCAAGPAAEEPSAPQHDPPASEDRLRRFFRLRPRRWLTGLAAVVLVLAAGGASLLWLHKSPPAAPDSPLVLGVVPFDCTGDAAQELGESLRLDLLDALSEVPSVQVRAAHSLGSVQEEDASIRRYAGKLQLDLLLFGHFHMQGEHLQLRLELVRGRDAEHLASFQYEGTKAELASLREKMQSDIFSQLRLVNEPVQRMKGSTTNPQAYEKYLRARFFLSQRTDESTRKALEQFSAAVELDPSFSRAYAGEATTYLIRADYQFAPARESFRQAEAFANRALQAGSAVPEAYGVLGYVLLQEHWDMVRAEEQLRHAIALEPNAAIYHVWYAVVLSDLGRFAESYQQIDLAHASDPLWAPIYGAETFLACNARDSARELAAAQKLMKLMPQWPVAYDELGWSYWHAKRYREAVESWMQMAIQEKDAERGNLEKQGLEALRSGGSAAYARQRVNYIRFKRRGNRYANDFILAEWYGFAGDQQGALAELQAMIDRHDPAVLQIAVNPAYDLLRHNPQFESLVRALRLTESTVGPRLAVANTK